MISPINKVIYLSETMLEAIETSKKVKFQENTQDFEVFEENCKNFNFFGMNCRNLRFWLFFVASDLIVNHQRYITCRV